MSYVTIEGVRFPIAAAAVLEQFESDIVAIDLQGLRDGVPLSRLLEKCMEGCDDAATRKGWRAYVEALALHYELEMTGPV